MVAEDIRDRAFALEEQLRVRLSLLFPWGCVGGVSPVQQGDMPYWKEAPSGHVLALGSAGDPLSLSHPVLSHVCPALHLFSAGGVP